MNITPDSTSQSIQLVIKDTSSITGEGLTGLVYNTAGLTAYYCRTGGTAQAISLVTQTPNGAWTSGGFCEIDSTNMKGVYRLDLPNAMLASGAESVSLQLRGAANMAPVDAIISLRHVAADLRQIDGDALVDAVLTLKKLELDNDGDAALQITSINAASTVFISGEDVGIQVEADSSALYLLGSGENGVGLALLGTYAGAQFGSIAGIGAIFGSVSGVGIRVEAGTDQPAIHLVGNGGDPDVATVLIEGGGTAGHGIEIITFNGDGLRFTTAGSGKVDIRANTTGNRTGNVSGSVGSVGSGGITASSFAANSLTAAALATDAVTEIQSGLATSSALAAVAVVVTAIEGHLNDDLDAILEIVGTSGVKLHSTGITTAAANKLADHFLRRTWANARASEFGDSWDPKSALGGVARLVNKVSIDGSTLTVYGSDDVTPIAAANLGINGSAQPVVSITPTAL